MKFKRYLTEGWVSSLSGHFNKHAIDFVGGWKQNPHGPRLQNLNDFRVFTNPGAAIEQILDPTKPYPIKPSDMSNIAASGILSQDKYSACAHRFAVNAANSAVKGCAVQEFAVRDRTRISNNTGTNDEPILLQLNPVGESYVRGAFILRVPKDTPRLKAIPYLQAFYTFLKSIGFIKKINNIYKLYFKNNLLLSDDDYRLQYEEYSKNFTDYDNLITSLENDKDKQQENLDAATTTYGEELAKLKNSYEFRLKCYNKLHRPKLDILSTENMSMAECLKIVDDYLSTVDESKLKWALDMILCNNKENYTVLDSTTGDNVNASAQLVRELIAKKREQEEQLTELRADKNEINNKITDLNTLYLYVSMLNTLLTALETLTSNTDISDFIDKYKNIYEAAVEVILPEDKILLTSIETWFCEQVACAGVNKTTGENIVFTVDHPSKYTTCEGGAEPQIISYYKSSMDLSAFINSQGSVLVTRNIVGDNTYNAIVNYYTPVTRYLVPDWEYDTFVSPINSDYTVTTPLVDLVTNMRYAPTDDGGYALRGRYIPQSPSLRRRR